MSSATSSTLIADHAGATLRHHLDVLLGAAASLARGDVRQAHALDGAIGAVADDLQALGAPECLEALGDRDRIAEAARAHDDSESRLPGGVRILIGGDVEALGASVGDQIEGLAGAVPHRGVAHLDVRDLHRQSSFAADADRLRNRIHDALFLVARMRHVEAASRCRHLGERDELFGGGIEAGVVLEPARQAEGAAFHSARHLLGHDGDLALGGLAPIVVAHGASAQRPVADHGADVDRRGDLLDAGQIVVDWPGGAAVGADDHGGHALSHLRGGSGVAREAVGRVVVDVDKAGCQRQPMEVLVGVGAARAQAAGGADRGDTIALDQQVAHVGSVARPVDDERVGEQQGWRLRPWDVPPPIPTAMTAAKQKAPATARFLRINPVSVGASTEA